MGPIIGLAASMLLFAISMLCMLILWPFHKIKEAAFRHPRRTAKMLLGALAAGIFAYVFELPYVVEVSVAGGAAGLLVDMVL